MDFFSNSLILIQFTTFFVFIVFITKMLTFNEFDFEDNKRHKISLKKQKIAKRHF